jgi:hypothetical protein
MSVKMKRREDTWSGIPETHLADNRLGIYSLHMHEAETL